MAVKVQLVPGLFGGKVSETFDLGEWWEVGTQKELTIFDEGEVVIAAFADCAWTAVGLTPYPPVVES